MEKQHKTVLKRRHSEFFLEKQLPLYKNEKLFDFLNVYYCKFQAFTIKNFLGNATKSNDFTFDYS